MQWIKLQYRKIINKYAELSGGAKEFIQWQGHDFSFRGHTSFESAITSAAGHALSFTGSDTVPVISFFEEYYGANLEKELIVGSVSATEHSVMCMGIGQLEKEIDDGLHNDTVKEY